jgi:Tol biopolymer transport system component
MSPERDDSGSLAPDDRLDSWKEIAAYLKRDVTTVQRWEKRESMPVHRHLHDKLGSVYAFRSELERWTRGRKPQPPDAGSGEFAEVPSIQAGAASGASGNGYWIAAALAGAVGVAAITAALWARRPEGARSDRAGDPRIQFVTDFDGLDQAAAISRDGRVAAFLSDRDGRTDVWVTRLGSGQFRNLTRGAEPELINPSVRTLGFAPDGESVAYWVRRPGANGAANIGIRLIPAIGGPSSAYLDEVAEFDWTRDRSRLVYHTTGPGDPMFVTSDAQHLPGTRIFAAPAGLHAHYPVWSPDGAFIYFVQGSLPDKMDIWRMRPNGSEVERVTTLNSRVSHPTFIDSRTLGYLASDADGGGPWLHSLDLDTRASRRLLTGADRYTSLAADAAGARLLVTAAGRKRTLWRLSLRDAVEGPSKPSAIDLPNGTGFSPRLGPDYLVYVSSDGSRQHLWKLAGGKLTELWSGADVQMIGAPAISTDGTRIAFSVRTSSQTVLYAMRADGSDMRVLTDSLALSGAPAWTPDGRFITSAADDRGTPRLVNIPIDGSAPAPLVQKYATDPSWSPDGGIVAYSGPDIGTTFTIESASVDGSARRVPSLTLTRGSRHLAFAPHALVFLRGDIAHKDLWTVNLETGEEKALTHLGADWDITDFDLSPDASEVVLERSQTRSNIALVELRRPPGR